MSSTVLEGHPAPLDAAAPLSDEAIIATAPVKDEVEALYDSFEAVKLGRKNMDWPVFFWMAGMHLGALAAPFFFTWQAAVTALVLHWATASIGICLAYHRYLTHRSFKLRQPASFLVTLCGVLSGEGTPLQWCAVHRLHHKRSDLHGDPHSPLEGAWGAHLYLMFVKKTPEERATLYRRFIPELAQKPMLQFFEKTFLLWLIASGVVLYAVGGLPMLLWGLCLRMVIAYHSTWFVNSATHLWGYRNYKTRDESRNLWWVAILSYGEGWHNNHHAHPANARAGHRWWEFDPTFWAIRCLQAVGMAYDIKDRIPETGAAAEDGPAADEADAALAA